MKSFFYVVLLLNGCLFFDSTQFVSSPTSNNRSTNNDTSVLTSKNNRSSAGSSNNASVGASNNASSTHGSSQSSNNSATNGGTSNTSNGGTSNTSNGGTTNNATLPLEIEPKVESGDDFSCALESDGGVKCWGLDNSINFTTPITRLSCGFAHCCGLTLAGDIVCSGKDDTAYIPAGTTTPPADENQRTGKTETQMGPFTDVSAGGEHSCGLKMDKSIFCWGRPGDFDRGNPANKFRGNKEITGSFTEISSGGFHVCAKTDVEKVMCFGGKEFRDQDYHQANPPNLKLSGRPGSLRAGLHRSCAILDTGKVHCWGRDITAAAFPWPQGQGESYKAISLGDNWGCGIKESGPTTCWGMGFGTIPTVLFSSIATGTRHACGILKDSATIQCWGSSIKGATSPP